jgi:hypothetical protein
MILAGAVIEDIDDGVDVDDGLHEPVSLRNLRLQENASEVQGACVDPQFFHSFSLVLQRKRKASLTQEEHIPAVAPPTQQG